MPKNSKRTTTKTITIVWFLLMTLTVASFYLSENQFSGFSLAVVLMAITVAKFMSVSLWFMELKQAHPVWSLALVMLLTVFSALIIFSTG